MSKWRKKPVVVEATQWFRNGDHPLDDAFAIGGDERGNGLPQRYEREGKIVRYFCHPRIDETSVCEHCGQAMDKHGWIDTPEGGHNVCPGDWIITGVKGEHYPCKPDIFAQTYEHVVDEDESMYKQLVDDLLDGAYIPVNVWGTMHVEEETDVYLILCCKGNRYKISLVCLADCFYEDRDSMAKGLKCYMEASHVTVKPAKVETDHEEKPAEVCDKQGEK